MNRAVERQRGRIVACFVAANLAQDFFIAIGNVLSSLSVSMNNFSLTMKFVQYDQARKYRDLTGGDFGEVLGCRGHFTGECSHRTEGEEGD